MLINIYTVQRNPGILLLSLKFNLKSNTVKIIIPGVCSVYTLLTHFKATHPP